MIQKVTIAEVLRATEEVAQKVLERSALLVTENGHSVNGIKVYGHDAVTAFLELHNGCMPEEERAEIVVDDLPDDSAKITSEVFRLGYLVVCGRSPVGGDYGHLAPRLLLLSTIGRAERTWRDGLRRKAEQVATMLGD